MQMRPFSCMRIFMPKRCETSTHLGWWDQHKGCLGHVVASKLLTTLYFVANPTGHQIFNPNHSNLLLTDYTPKHFISCLKDSYILRYMKTQPWFWKWFFQINMVLFFTCVNLTYVRFTCATFTYNPLEPRGYFQQPTTFGRILDCS